MLVCVDGPMTHDVIDYLRDLLEGEHTVVKAREFLRRTSALDWLEGLDDSDPKLIRFVPGGVLGQRAHCWVSAHRDIQQHKIEQIALGLSAILDTIEQPEPEQEA